MIEWQNLKEKDKVYLLTFRGYEELRFASTLLGGAAVALINSDGSMAAYDIDNPLITTFPEEVADHLEELAKKWRERCTGK